MPNPTQTRILTEAHDPLVARLWRAMAGLRSVVGFMNTGAHPDDETSAMLAALWLRDGVNLSYACSTRGEGGQNDIGTESGSDLGTLRTAEMERAAEVLDMRLYWHGQAADDTISDFRFSKSGVETMGIWGRDRLIERFVHIVRTERPDVICPTFLDIPGQHGHHRAMTEAAHDVIALAGDPTYAGCDLPAWQVSKLYLPAFSGAGGAYDDEVPPPPATVTVAAKGGDPMLGMSYERIGQWSRHFHRTQGMGRWVAAGEERDWPLHLAWSAVGDDTGHVIDNLPQDLGAIGLIEAQSAIEECCGSFPDLAAVRFAATRAFAALQAANVPEEHAHRVARKQAQLARVIRLASGVDARARPERAMISPGEDVAVTVELDAGIAEVTTRLVPGVGLVASETGLSAKSDAPATDPYPDSYDPLVPRAPALSVTTTIDDITSATSVALETPLLILPNPRARLSETSAFVNLSAQVGEVTLTVDDRSAGDMAFDLPDGWTQRWQGSEVTLIPPADVPPGLHHVPLTIDGAPAFTTRLITHDHVPLRLNHSPAVLTVRLAEVALPAARIAYVGAGNDRVVKWLVEAGFDVVELDDTDLGRPDPFANFDTVLVGVFAYRFRAALAPLTEGLNAWVAAGGNLVTLYHRPWDNWDPESTPPARIEIGQPSLRWRITNAQAQVTTLAEQHPVLTSPNQITSDDWNGWQKERGLYFAKGWDPVYTPILRMADPEEQPLDGGLLVGEIGNGRHIHVALNLHHQLTQLVPGAYRLFANLLTPHKG